MSEFKCPYLCAFEEKVSNLCDSKACAYKAYLQGRAEAIEQCIETLYKALKQLEEQKNAGEDIESEGFYGVAMYDQ